MKSTGQIISELETQVKHWKQTAETVAAQYGALRGAQPVADTRTIEELITEAWSAQDACNASGLVFSFAKAMRRLCDLLPHGGRNRNLVTQLWVAKLADLCAVDTIDWSKAAQLVDAINEGRSHDPIQGM